ncbi:IS3 family transposase [Candidatus Cetobacterium colombiensis]|uniref:IS3 family transposase n=1 Tax=Candidatus Cetobacterium colombiensis TaxID=3073100 RepID=A0ABU4WEX6_9FUSO|nr:IS3 family transposase [Candidatus Cetobacterium colombiensis]MDX8337043.1 IS3 family transposase [Candidatus Cetobacterium colombiensis]
MAHRKNISIEEKIEAIKYCIENNRNYIKTSEMFNVSYQQIYLWVKKYDISGVDSLEDHRGKQKLKLNDEDKQKLEVHKLQKEIELLKAENLLNRKFEATLPNEKWVTDVTEFKYGDGKKAYLSAILNLYDRSIISYVLSHRNDNPLVFKTLDLAIAYNPMVKGLLHSDRGYQYTSKTFKASMSRVGRCIDNGPMEGFWGSLKSESYYLKRFETFEELEANITEYINFYNIKILQKKLNSLSPLEYRAQAA